MTDLDREMAEMGQAARVAAHVLASAEAAQKTAAIDAAANAIAARRRDILAANARDLEAAAQKGLSGAMLDRLQLDDKRVEGIVEGLRAVAAQDDPVGETIAAWTRPNDLEIARVRIPIGVVAIIYESRPNVTADAGALCLKSGNAAILRGGSESFFSSRALHACLCAGLKKAGLPETAIQFVRTTDRAAVGALLSGLDGNVDLIVPRGGKSLVARVNLEARAPVLSHLDGICHVYIDRDADPVKAVEIAVNAKMRRPGVCGAAETLLIDRAVLDSHAAPVLDALSEAGCTLRGDAAIRAVYAQTEAATEEDWRTEYLDSIISVAAVDGVGGAIEHINRFSSGHTESIITENDQTAEKFLTQVDSAIVMRNASTQFADGGEFGLGAEIGIATGRLHARGPVGAEGLTTYKYVVRGSGQTRP
ncbi:MAG: glutamate-5-semialdehyde dehydrogenase [Parvularculaceae bacterium]